MIDEYDADDADDDDDHHHHYCYCYCSCYYHDCYFCDDNDAMHVTRVKLELCLPARTQFLVVPSKVVNRTPSSRMGL